MMKRRQFLQAAGLTGIAMGTAGGIEADDNVVPRLNRDLLSARNQNRSTVVCQNGIVCASQPLAAQAGLDILKAGGNCVDAAICTNAMLGLTEPASNGIGGDLFAIVWIESEKQLYGLNASGRAPYAWDLNAAQEFGLQEIPRASPLSWTTPGCVRGWEALSEKLGSLDLARCLDAAIDYAVRGFPISPIISKHFDFDPNRAPSLARVYHPNGRRPRYGEVFRNEQLAASYQAIAEQGASAFYEGEIAERIVDKSRELGGKMSLKDLQSCNAAWVRPVSANYRGWDLWEMPPNGQGIAALQILNLLEQFDVGQFQANSAEHLHLFLEAKKLAFEDRAQYYADQEFADVPVEQLISKDYARQRAKLIDLQEARTELRFGDPALDADTVYLAAADRDGNMISLIQSLYSGFGSTICPDSVGFSIQNRGQGFSLDPDHRNRLEPHKRPFHTIIPAFLTRNERPVLAFGVMGGDFQPQGHAQVIMNMIDFGMSPQQAGDQARIAHSGSSKPWGGKAVDGGRVHCENGISSRTIEGLIARGHQIEAKSAAHGGYQAIWRLDDPVRYFGGSDPRKDGAAVGY